MATGAIKTRLLERDPPELVIVDEVEECPYLPEQRARFPMRLPLRPLTRAETDIRLAEGDRRYGRLLYRTECPTCRACEPIRVLAREFIPSRSMRRVLRRGDESLTVQMGEPQMSDDRLKLYEAHKMGRGLAVRGDRPIDEARYYGFLVDRSVEAFELRFFLEGHLVGYSICDRAESALSAVYCAYDPDQEHLSIGTYAILKQLELCRKWGLEYLYLGLYIERNRHVRYKARFVPHERLIDGAWHRFAGE